MKETYKVITDVALDSTNEAKIKSSDVVNFSFKDKTLQFIEHNKVSDMLKSFGIKKFKYGLLIGIACGFLLGLLF